MNKKWLPHGISAGALAVFIVLGLACASAPAKWANITYSGEETPLLANTTWDLTLGNNYGVIKFQPGGKLSYIGQYDYLYGRSGGYGTWERTGNNVKFITNGDYAYEGIYRDRQITGTYETSGEKTPNGEFIMLLLQQ